MSCRPHLRQHLARRRLHGLRHRRLQSLHRWLEGLDHAASGARPRRVGDGDLVKRHDRPQGSGPSLRPRGPVPRHSLHRTPRRRRRDLLGRVARRFLRQCPGRVGHRPLQDRAHPQARSVALFEQLELATARWVEWYNQRRLHSSVGDVPPAEFEATYYRERAVSAVA